MMVEAADGRTYFYTVHEDDVVTGNYKCSLSVGFDCAREPPTPGIVFVDKRRVGLSMLMDKNRELRDTLMYTQQVFLEDLSTLRRTRENIVKGLCMEVIIK